MKAFAFLIILTAFGMFGAAFFGVVQVPGLEDIPTYQSLGLGKEKEEEPKKKESGIFPLPAKAKKPIPTSAQGAAAGRNRHLNALQDQVEGR